MSRPNSDKLLPDILGLIFWIVITFGVAAFASQFMPGDWYTTLKKPTWTPPGWIFGPVWGLLYLAMSLSAWLIWRERLRRRVFLPLGFYGIQLFINGLWSWLFFGKQLIGGALVDIVLLVIALTITIVVFYRTKRLSGILLIPYLIWVLFATALNFQIWRLN